MRCLFTSDLHGHRLLYTQLEQHVRMHAARLVLLGGDLLADATPDLWHQQLEFVRGPFRKWISHLRDHGAEHIGFLHGNHDWSATDDALHELESDGLLSVLPAMGWHKLGPLTLFCYAYTPPSPFVVKDFEKHDLQAGETLGQAFEGCAFDPAAGRPVDVSLKAFLDRRPSIEADLAAIDGADDPWVLVCHGPPRESTADLLWLPSETRGDLSPQQPANVNRLHVGSAAIAQFIARTQPDLCLHGHIHESPYLTGRYVSRHGRSVVVNPGQRRDGLHGVVFESQDVGLRSLELLHTIWGPAPGPAETAEQLPPRPSFLL